MGRISRSTRCLLVLILAVVAAAANGQDVTLAPVADGTATDNGPADGTFDVLDVVAPSLGVVDNGYTEIRAALEFNISSVTEQGAARLVLVGGNDEGRRVAAHGYTTGAGGRITLADFARNGLQSVSAPINAYGSVVALDVTSIVTAALDAAQTHVGVNVRETTTGALTLTFGSSSAAGATSRPRLEIFYFLFADGFESGNVNGWSSASP